MVGGIAKPEAIATCIRLLELDLLAARSGAPTVVLDHEAGAIALCHRRAEGLTMP